MARRFPSFLTVESKLNGSLKINEHLIESYLDIVFLLLGYLICARRQHYYRFFVDVAIFGLRLYASFAIGDWRKKHS